MYTIITINEKIDKELQKWISRGKRENCVKAREWDCVGYKKINYSCEIKHKEAF